MQFARSKCKWCYNCSYYNQQCICLFPFLSVSSGNKISVEPQHWQESGSISNIKWWMTQQKRLPCMYSPHSSFFNKLSSISFDGSFWYWHIWYWYSIGHAGHCCACWVSCIMATSGNKTGCTQQKLADEVHMENLPYEILLMQIKAFGPFQKAIKQLYYTIWVVEKSCWQDI